MKQIAISLIIVLGIFSISFAGEIEDLQKQQNQTVTQILKLQGQGELLAQQWQEQTEKYVETKNRIQDALDRLNQQSQDLSAKIAGLRKDSEKNESQKPAEPGK